ncbi:hypothetical protein KCU65_g9878, partial [Aureobasidium melanogenum]
MMLHLSFAFAVAFLSVSVISSAFNGPRMTSAIDNEVSFAHGWTPRPTSGSVVRKIRRQNARNVLTELWAPDNVCGYNQRNASLPWACPKTATCVFFPRETDTFGFLGCGTSSTILSFATACVDYSQYLSSSSLYNQDDYIKICTDPAAPYCNTAGFPELSIEDYLHDFDYVDNFDSKLLFPQFDFKPFFLEFDSKLFFVDFDYKLPFLDICLFELFFSDTNAEPQPQKSHGCHRRKCGWSCGRRSGGSPGNVRLSKEAEAKTI